MRGSRGRVLTASLLLLGAASSLLAYETVQLERGPQNHLLVPAKVNGRAATFLLDSGVRVNFLQNSRVAPLGIRLLGRQTQNAGRSFPAGAIDDLRLGNVSLGAAEVALFEPAQFRGPVPGRGGRAADGMIGLELLRRQKAIINCRTQQLFLQRGSTNRLNLAGTTGAAGFMQIPIRHSVRDSLLVPCTFRGKSAWLAIDTGAFLTVFDAAAVQRQNLETKPIDHLARTASGRVGRLELAMVDDLQIGGVRIPAQRFAVMDLLPPKKPLRTSMGLHRLETYDARALKERRDLIGLLGSELLYQHHAIIDLDSMTLFLK